MHEYCSSISFMKPFYIYIERNCSNLFERHLSQESWSSLSCEAAASRVRRPGTRKSTRPLPSLQATPILTMRTKGRTSRWTIACNTSILCRCKGGANLPQSHLLPAALPSTHWHTLQVPCTLPAGSCSLLAPGL